MEELFLNRILNSVESLRNEYREVKDSVRIIMGDLQTLIDLRKRRDDERRMYECEMVTRFGSNSDDEKLVNQMIYDEGKGFDLDIQRVRFVEGGNKYETKFGDIHGGEVPKRKSQFGELNHPTSSSGLSGIKFGSVSSTNLCKKNEKVIHKTEASCGGMKRGKFDDKVFKMSSQFGETLLQREMSMKKARVGTIKSMTLFTDVKGTSHCRAGALGGSSHIGKVTMILIFFLNCSILLSLVPNIMYM
ncbi:uncharacterized protein LOC133834543 isoform X1 [Humulus lupulus]|uniref:uncharacterized protein LOC133834543 isoform X1 n=1 Tax=Humulus lupulus TaxID=3486 RepID=UPI002B401AD8|nr:uncharacterized protein LOC133834543 isoform X1 [Humulus lupulus]